MYKRILDCISSKTFAKRVNKILISFIFFFIVEPLREPFPYLKTALSQKFFKKTLWPLFMDGVQLPQG